MDNTPNPPLTPEQLAWLNNAMRDDAHRAHDNAAEFICRVNDAVIANASLGLKMGLLINSGSVVSLLTFIGSLPANQRSSLAGAGLAGFGFLFAYLTNYLTVLHAASGRRSGNTLGSQMVRGPVNLYV